MKAYDGFYNRIGKRWIGFILSIQLIAILLPIYLLIGITIIVDDGFPVFYRPLRGGYRNRPFIVWKFGIVGANKTAVG